MNIRNAFCAVLLVLSTASAVSAQEHAHTEDELKPGDELYMHHYYHDIYRTLRKKYGLSWDGFLSNSCCNDGECRVTLPFKAATPKQEADGYSYQIFVDGKWCPARKQSLVTLSPEMRLRALNDPHIQDFLQKDHVCASYPFVTPYGATEKTPEDQKNDPNVCPMIHCIMEGGARS